MNCSTKTDKRKTRGKSLNHRRILVEASCFIYYLQVHFVACVDAAVLEITTYVLTRVFTAVKNILRGSYNTVHLGLVTFDT